MGVGLLVGTQSVPLLRGERERGRMREPQILLLFTPYPQGSTGKMGGSGCFRDASGLVCTLGLLFLLSLD